MTKQYKEVRLKGSYPDNTATGKSFEDGLQAEINEKISAENAAAANAEKDKSWWESLRMRLAARELRHKNMRKVQAGGVTLQLTPEQSIEFASLKDDAARRAYLAKLELEAKSQTLRKISRG